MRPLLPQKLNKAPLIAPIGLLSNSIASKISTYFRIQPVVRTEIAGLTRIL